MHSLLEDSLLEEFLALRVPCSSSKALPPVIRGKFTGRAS